MIQKEVNEILRKHNLWLEEKEGGKKWIFQILMIVNAFYMGTIYESM